jgi:hypothetical protein
MQSGAAKSFFDASYAREQADDFHLNGSQQVLNRSRRLADMDAELEGKIQTVAFRKGNETPVHGIGLCGRSPVTA